MSANELQKPAKGDKEKVEMAARLRRETTMTGKWIAETLATGHWTTAANLLPAKPKSK